MLRPITIYCIIMFLCGLYIVSSYTANDIKEGFTGKRTNVNNNNCPDILIQNGKSIYLKNSKLAEIPGVNPIKFNNLEEYTEFLDWQRSQGYNCPVLFLQQTEGAQGESIYKVQPHPTDLRGGLQPQPNDRMLVTSLLHDANQNEAGIYNRGLYPAFDTENQYIGEEVPLDKLYNEGKLDHCSANPMDTNWCGKKYSESRVKAGDYKNREVRRY